MLAGIVLATLPRRLIAWYLPLALGLAFVAYVELGPPISRCACLGVLGALGEEGRSVLAWLLLALSLAGLAVTRSLSEPQR